MLSKSVGSLPCNWQQVYNASKQQKACDPLYGLISITLAMDYQLVDIEAFCTNSDHCSVLSVDPTFDLGSLM